MTSTTVVTSVGSWVVLLVATTCWSWESATVTGNELLSNWASLALIALLLSQLDSSTLVATLDEVLASSSVSISKLTIRAVVTSVGGRVVTLIALAGWLNYTLVVNNNLVKTSTSLASEALVLCKLKLSL